MASDKNPEKPVNKVSNVLTEDQASAHLVELMRAQQNALKARAMSSGAAADTTQQNSGSATDPKSGK